MNIDFKTFYKLLHGFNLCGVFTLNNVLNTSNLEYKLARRDEIVENPIFLFTVEKHMKLLTK